MSRAPATSRARAGGHEPLREMPAGLADDPEQPLRGVALDPTGVKGLPAVGGDHRELGGRLFDVADPVGIGAGPRRLRSVIASASIARCPA